jgi:hypothetical protein
MEPGVDSDVTPSSRRFLQSTRCPQCYNSSTRMIGTWTSNITKRHVKSRRSPRFKLRDVHPYMRMVVPLAANDIVCELPAHWKELTWEDAQVGPSVR